MTEQAGNKAGGVSSRVKRNILNTLTEPTWQRGGSCLLVGSTFVHEMRGVNEIGGLEEHAEPRWHRLDRACLR